MNVRKTLGRAALSCEVEDGLLDIDQILNTEPWTQINDFVQHNFLQDILNEFNEQIALDPERAPKEEAKKPRMVKSKRTPQKKKEASDENRASNSKASGGEKLKDKIEKSSIRKKKNGKKSNVDSGKIEKKKGMACGSKKGAGKSAKDQKTQGNSPEANPGTTVTMSDDDNGTPIVEEMAEPMEVTHEMETWQDIAGISYEITMPTGESSRIEELTLPRNLVGTSETTVADCPSVSQVHSETITNEEGEERRERKSLRKSRGECSHEEKHLLETTAEKETSPDHEFDESKRRKRQPAGKSSCLQGEGVVEKSVSKSPGGKGDERKFLSKCSDEKDSAEKTVEKNISTSQGETDVAKKTGRKSLRRSKCLEEQNPAEKEISDDEDSSGQTKAKRRSLEASKSSKGKESAEKIAKKNIPSSHKETDVEKKTGRKSLRKSKCLEEEDPADKQISDDAECTGRTRAKKRFLEASKSSKDSAEKIVEKNISTSREETDAGKKASKSVGTSTYLDKENPARKQISDEEECSKQTRAKRKSSEISKSSKDSAEMTAKKKIPNEEPDGKKKEKSTEREKDPAKKQVSKDRRDFVKKKKTETNLKCSRGDKCVVKKEKDKKTRVEKPWKKQNNKFVAIKDKKVGKHERRLLQKRRRREIRKMRKHERQANLAMARFGRCVTKIVKKMGYVEESKLEFSDGSDSSDSSSSSGSSSSSSSSYTSDSEESSSSSFTTCHSSSSSIVSCSCSSDHGCQNSFCPRCSKICSNTNCQHSSPCSCIDYTDTSDCSELTSSSD